MYEVKYVLNDAAGVKKLLRDRHHISSARFQSGDYNAVDMLVDLSSAINSAGLSEVQAEVVAWISGADMTQQQASEIMHVTRQAITKAYEVACEKIAAVYRKWEYGEVCVGYLLEDEDYEGEAA
ncbi:hypothetical protein D3C75_794860 [compost metagenome]